MFLDDLAGIDEIAIDLKGKKLTIIGTVDPVAVASKLRKYWQTDILLVGPAKEPEKKEEPKKEPKKEEAKKEEGKEEAKKEEPKKEEGKKEEPKKEDEKKGDSEPASAPAAAAAPPPGAPAHAPAAVPAQIPVSMQMQMPVVGSAMPYRPYYPPMHTYYQVHHSIEENPNACVIS